MPFGGPGRQILAQDGVEVGARVAGIVEVLGERGQIRVGLGGHAVAVDDDRPPIREDSEDLGGVDVAGGVDLGLLLPDHAADGADDGQDDRGDDGDDDDAGATVGALLRQAHLRGLRAHGIDVGLLLLSHDLTFQN